MRRSSSGRRAIWWAFAWALLRTGLAEELPDANATQTNDDDVKDTRGIFSPRMDYDQWKPLGRGDPLKNDPTYDYVPPVLDRVHYWIDPALRKPDPPLPEQNQKTEILLLGVSSKKPSTGTSVADSRKDTYDSFLKFVDAPKFNHHQRITRPHHPMASSYYPPTFYTKSKPQFGKGGEQRVPYTMLMPPPMVTKTPSSPPPPQAATSSVKSTPATTTAPATTTSQVTVQEANLVYQSSSFGGLTDWRNTETSTSLTPNPVSFTTSTFNEEVVFQKLQQPPNGHGQVQFAPNFTGKPLLASNSDHSVNYVTAPPPLRAGEEVMHKGSVSDDNLDISNTYVKIGKTEAQVHSTAIDNIPELPSLMVFPHVPLPTVQTPMTMQTIQSMQTMQPPPITTSPVYKQATNPIIAALEKEKTTSEMSATTDEDTTTATTTTSLTTDPLFKHYKQPAEPLKGPLYLIIQGHSKVKTYGPSKQIHGIRVQETNEIGDEKEEVKHLHQYRRNSSAEGAREARSGDLQTLKHVIQAKLGAIDFGNVRRGDEDVKEAELQFGYKVGEGTSEKYRKGIVEEARKLGR